MPYYEATLRGRKDPVRFGADRIDEGQDWLIAYDERGQEVIKFQTGQVIALQKLDEGGPFGVA
jgi:hypothetical protein